MTPEIQELRDWAARKVGWEYRNLSDSWHPVDHKTILPEQWEKFWQPSKRPGLRSKNESHHYL